MISGSIKLIIISLIKITLLGDGGVGKTTFVQHHINVDFTTKYVATRGAEVKQMTLETNYGRVALNVWDCAGQEKYGGTAKGNLEKSDGCIVMFDVTSRTSFKNIEKWMEEYKKRNPDSPIIVCGNKVEEKSRRVSPGEILKKLRETEYPYYDISTKACYNIDEPILKLCGRMMGHEDVELTNAPRKN